MRVGGRGFTPEKKAAKARLSATRASAAAGVTELRRIAMLSWLLTVCTCTVSTSTLRHADDTLVCLNASIRLTPFPTFSLSTCRYSALAG